MRRVSWKLWVILAASLFLNISLLGTRVPESSLETFRRIRTALAKINYDTPPAQTDGYQNIQSTEWPFFSLVYFGYSGCNIAQTDPSSKKEALDGVHWALEKLQTRHICGFVEPHFGPAFGKDFRKPSIIFHGHFLMLALRYRELSGDTRYDALIHTVAEAFAQAYAAESSGILPSYPGMWWPTDNVSALSALRLHDRIYQTQIADAPCRRWVENMRKHYTDPKTGLICSYIDPKKQATWSGPRGVALMNAIPFLKEADPTFTQEQYALCKKYLVGNFVGLQAAREFPVGSDEAKDVDSGEVILGMGQAASGFAISAAAAMNDRPFHNGLLDSLGLVKIATGTGLIPLTGDCVILFGKTFPFPFTDAVAKEK